MDVINFILNPKNDFLGQTAAYLQICGISILGAVLIGVALGAAVSRNSFLVCTLFRSWPETYAYRSDYHRYPASVTQYVHGYSWR
ncbi:MAG: hypothetical protein NVS4B12_29370 [Ktedonobacteraceae bacterium]